MSVHAPGSNSKVLEPLNPSPTISSMKILRENIIVPYSRVFTLTDFLTQEECEYYIEQSEKLGYETLEKEFLMDYRNNERCSVYCENLAKVLWDRVKGLLVAEDIENVRPFGWGTEGKWKPIRLDNWFKFSKYTKGKFFKAHLDSPFVKNEDERSVYTIMVFLNDNFSGGNTNFRLFDPQNDSMEGEKITVASVTPKKGKALVFNHDTLHEGLPVLEGVKYILRTEIVFERIEKLPSLWRSDPIFIKCVELYKTSENLEKEGKIKESSEAFLEALLLQAKKCHSIPRKENTTNSNDVQVPFWGIPEVVAGIFLQLSLQQILKARIVSKSWCKILTTDTFWHDFYQYSYNKTFHLQMSSIKNSSKDTSFQYDWYNLYKQRYLINKNFRAVCIDFGSAFIKYSILGEDWNNKPVPNLVGFETSVHNISPGVDEDEQWRVGEEAKSLNSANPAYGVNTRTKKNLLEAVITWIFQVGLELHGSYPPPIARTLAGTLPRGPSKNKFPPSVHPVVVVLPFWNPFDNSTFVDTIKTVLASKKVPYVYFAEPAPMALAACSKHTGIVVYSGHQSTVVAYVKNGKTEKTENFPFTGKFLKKLAAVLKSKKGGISTCTLSLDFENEKKVCPVANLWQFSAPEGMFNPSVQEDNWPEELPNSEGIVPFVHKFITKIISEIEVESEKVDLWNSVVLCGGTVAIPNFFIRFNQEMQSLNPNFTGVVSYCDVEDTFIDPNDLSDIEKFSYQSGYTLTASTEKSITCSNLIAKGASYFASLSGFKEMCEEITPIN